MAEKKHISFALLQILQEETDENHTLSAGELMERINNRLNLNIERRTVYSNIDILRQAGYDIPDYSASTKGYWLKSGQFDKGEILLLCNAVHASHFISHEQSEALIEKLLGTLSRHQRKEFRDNVYLPNHQKSSNDTLFRNIELISQAIDQRRKISFAYLRYNSNKELVPRRKQPYTVEPRYIVYNDSRPYLISTSENHPGFTHWRLDRIKDVVLHEEKIRPLKKADETEAYAYATGKLFMFTGETEWVTFLCEERIMDQMIDIFGPEMRIIPAGDGYFTARVRTTENGALFLAQQFLDAIEIVEPESVKERFTANLEKRLNSMK